MTNMKVLFRTAFQLESRLETEWAEEHEELYSDFEELIEYLYRCRKINQVEHDALALIAFYDCDIIDDDTFDAGATKALIDEYEHWYKEGESND